jgi:hypothetical protein
MGTGWGGLVFLEDAVPGCWAQLSLSGGTQCFRRRGVAGGPGRAESQIPSYIWTLKSIPVFIHQ